MFKISIVNADVDIRINAKRTIYHWIKTVIVSEGLQPGEVSIVLCSDKFLHQMNKQYLNHDYLTDIITFDYCEGKRVSGELYISIHRVKDNAKTFGISFKNELYRVMVHGVLHLCGHKDKTKKEQEEMRRKEGKQLAKLKI